MKFTRPGAYAYTEGLSLKLSLKSSIALSRSLQAMGVKRIVSVACDRERWNGKESVRSVRTEGEWEQIPPWGKGVISSNGCVDGLFNSHSEGYAQNNEHFSSIPT